MITIYTQRCLACSNRPLWKKVKAFAKEHNLPIKERRVGLRPEWKAEAERYEIALPFAVYGNTPVSLIENLEELLK